MIKLTDLLSEAKQVGILYHLVDKDAFIFNITNDKIVNRKDDQISFSRSKSFESIPRHLPKDKVYARFIIDGNQLSNKYKIFPVDDKYYKPKNTNKDLDFLFENKEDEFEERIIGVINNLGKYIIAIDIFKNTNAEIDNLLKQYLKKYPGIKINYV